MGLFFGFCVALEYGLYRLFEHMSPGSGPIVLLAGSALLAWPSARLLVEVLPGLHRSARRSVFKPWQGTYFTFNERQVRFFLVEDTIWIAEADVRAILEPPPDAREERFLGAEYADIPGQKFKGYTESALARLLHTRTSHRRATHDMIRFKRWLEHEALPNVRRLPSSSADTPPHDT
jgi:hypothetical protein